MLDPRPGPERSIRHPAGDPVAGLTALLLVAIAVGLLVAGVLAVADFTLPPVLGPVVLGLAASFIVGLLLAVGSVSVRSLRRGGR